MATCPSCTLSVRFPDSVPSIQLAAVEAPPEVNSQPKGPEGLMGKTVQQSQAKKLGFNGKVCMFDFSIDARRFSSFEAFLHVSVLCCRFLSRIRKAKFPTGPITVTDLCVAKTKWLSYVQQKDCGMVMTALSQKQPNQLTSN